MFLHFDTHYVPKNATFLLLELSQRWIKFSNFGVYNR